MQKTVDITPHTSLLPKLGKSGYTIPQAIAELVDNSIDAIRTNTTHTGSVKIEITPTSIKVIDNGSGMTEAQLTDSMRLAKSSKIDRLGKFGLGLKTAALSLGSTFQIVTKSNQEPYIYEVCYDEEKWSNDDQRWEIQIEASDAPEIEPFTELTISRLKSTIPATTIDKVIIDMGERYAPYIQSKEVEITVNGKRCQVKLPTIHKETYKEINIPLSINRIDHGTIKGWVALLVEGSNKGNYGFTTYWRNRMITRYDKIAIGEHPTISRIIGELHLDFLEPTHNKREFIKESDLYQEAERLLKLDLKDIITEARRKSNDDTLTPQIQDKVEKLTEATLQALNSLPDFKEFTSQFHSPILQRSENGDESYPFEVEKRNGHSNVYQEDKKSTPFSDQRSPEVIHKALRKGIRIKGKYFEFRHTFQHLGTKESIKQVSRNDDTKTIEVYTNIDFPAFSVSRDQSFYAFMNIADALAELFCSTIPGNSVSDIRELILRKAAEYTIINEA